MRNSIVKKSFTLALSIAALTSSFSFAQMEFLGDDLINKPALLTEYCCGDLYFNADLLVFKPCEDGLAYGIRRTQTFSPVAPLNTSITNKLKTPHLTWDAGVRLGLGFNPRGASWSPYLSWTHFDTSSKNHLNTTGLEGTEAVTVYPNYGANNLGLPTNLRNKFKLHTDWLDFEIGKGFYLGECVLFRPHIGARGVWIGQKIRTSYDDAIASTAVDFTGVIRLKDFYEGGGLRAGFDLNWDLGCGVSFIGSTAGSVLFGSQRIRESDSAVTTIAGTTTTSFYSGNNKFCSCKGAFDLLVGFRWDQVLFDCYYVGLQVSYEHHLFMNQNRFFNYSSNPLATGIYDGSRGNLALHGFSVSANVRF